VRPSTPTTQPPTETSPLRDAGPKNWAPHLDDPDPPPTPMTPEQHKEAARKVGDLMRKKGYWK
jgi:hypothetical protein